MSERKTIYLCLAHMSEEGWEQKYVKEAFDTKADAVGTGRTITFYSFTGQPLNSYTDKSMRFEALPTGGISVWLGSQNRKIHSNMNYIVEDK